MSKRKGLGSQLEKALEIMADTKVCLKKFTSEMKLIDGLKKVNIEDVDKLIEEAQKAMTAAYELSHSIGSLESKVGDLKIDEPRSLRFMGAKRVVANYLEGQ